MDFLRIILAVILPPAAVFTEVGFGKDFWINLILTMLIWIPGVIHAIYIIGKR